jgi:hypothetical protein
MKYEEVYMQFHICTADKALSATDREINADTFNRSWNCWPILTKRVSDTMGVQKYCNMFEKYGLLHNRVQLTTLVHLCLV